MKIGLLLPRSVLYPSMGFDIVDGLKARLGDAAQFVSINIGVGAKDVEVYTKAEQLIMDGVDAVVAYINPTTAEYIHPLFKGSDRILFVLDSGYHFPTEPFLSNAFFISLQGSLCCRLAANDAIMNGIKSFAFTCCFYDAGYRSPFAFARSVEKNGGAIQFNHVTALNKRDFTIQPLLDKANEGLFDGILASFCGDMTEDLFKSSAENGLFSKAKVVCSSFAAEELWLDKIVYPGADASAVVPWARNINLKENELFKAAFNKDGKANVFSLIAWELGGIIKDVADFTDTSKAIKKIEAYTGKSPRGEVRMNPDNHVLESPLYLAAIVKDDLTGNCKLKVVREIDSSIVLEEKLALADDIKGFEKVNNSWYNAYPCLES